MKLTFKNVKIHPDMSEETDCFSATIYADGKKAGTVKNDGRGGCHMYYWFDRALGTQIEAWAKTQPGQYNVLNRLDEIIDNMLTKQEILQQLKRWTKKDTVTAFRLKGDEKGTWRLHKVSYNAQILAILQNKFGSQLECVANQDLEAACSF
jgi:hypothetical protein